jgi:adenylate kinase family enzyme
MAKLTFLLGLCGSGKTYIAERLATQTGAQLFSDFLQDHNKNFPALVKNLTSGIDCIIDEWKYSIPRFRDKILADLLNVPNLEVEWICFENDRASADWNVVHRTNKADTGGHLRINEFLSDVYQYPEPAEILKITRIDAL